MKYTVVWVPSAEQDLATLWMESADRNTMASAANTIDAVLREDPQQRGESRFGAVRMLIVPPLGVNFKVLEADRLVKVGSVWMVRSR